MLPVWSKSLKQPYPNISTIESERHTLCSLSPLAQHSNKSERFGSQASSPKVAFPVSFPAKACSSSILLSSSWWRLRVHAFLSDRELSIHSHHLGLLVKLTERFCNQSVTVKHIHTPIRPMIENRVVLEFHLEFCVKVSYLLITLYGAFMFSRTKAITAYLCYSCCNSNELDFFPINFNYLNVNR